MNQLKQLPQPVVVLLFLLAGASLSGVVHLFQPKLTLIYFLGFVAVILLYLLYVYITAQIKKKQAAGFGAQLNSRNTQAPSNLNDPAKRARLDDLRRNFEKGIERYRSAGKDVYSLPWLLVVGEPGSGKTEAIRHSNVGFPPGLQDELQGVGGTINMNWWFTNRAVLLDTAGRLMFEEVEAGATSEWREFLGLLKKTRQNCPINGMLLVIPVDTLIKDTTEQIAKKSAKIAQQLDLIQRTLDVRFPVFVVITKCDLLNGFREFFDSLSDPQLQHQMLGWSNPAPLDDTFRPEQVDSHLATVADSLSKRRLALMKDPVAEKSGGRRTDEVDALYSLPTSLNALAPRLRRYLETIFIAGEWSAKPLFLRGIYFSSAMREGSALDLELAQAIGVSVESLPDGKAWERERAYFLRDLFLEKVFAERGLVTRASNTRQLLKRRRITLLASTSAGVLIVLLLSFFGYRSLFKSVGNESTIWQAALQGWSENRWNPIVTPEFKGSTNYVFNGAQPVAIGSKNVSLVEYHAELRNLTRGDIQVPLIFLPLEATVTELNPGRRQAQQALYEASVVRPIVDAARTKILTEKGPWTPAASQALGILIRIEGMAHNPNIALTADDLSGEAFLLPLLRFVVPQAPAASTADLAKTFETTYLTNASDRKKFPPAGLSGGVNLLDNKVIAAGLNRFFAQAKNDQKSQEAGFEMIRQIRRELRSYRQNEDELARLTGSVTDPAQLIRDASPLVTRVSEASVAVDASVKKLATSGIVDENFGTLSEAYKSLSDKAKASTDASFNTLQSELNRFSDPQRDNTKGSDYTLPAEIARLLKSNRQDLRDRVESSLTPKEEQELQALDEVYVVKSADGTRLYEVRANLYQRASDPLSVPANVTLVGGLGHAVETLRGNMKQVEDRSKALEGKEAPRAQAIARNLLTAGEYREIERLLTRYKTDLDALLAQNAAFPIIATAKQSLTPDAVKTLAATLKAATKDLEATAPGTTAWPSSLKTKFEALPTRAVTTNAILNAVIPAVEGQPTTVTVTLVAYNDQKKLMSQRLNNDQFVAKFAGSIWRTMRIGSGRVRTEAAATSDLGKFPLAANTFVIDFYRGVDDPNPDRSFNFSADWAVLRLLHQSYARRHDGGKEWELMLPLKDESGNERFLFLLLQFEKPLPEIADWNAAAKTP